MRFGFHAINLGALATAESVRQIVAACERYKIDSIWTGDHIINATTISSPYPYSPTGTFPLRPEEPILEPLTFMAFLAGQTGTIQIGVSVLIVPYRNPVVTARALGTMDFLSNGRVIVGVGSGWMKEEFDALGVPFADRGAQTDEFIRIFKEIWTNPQPQFAGKYYQFSGITAYPQPARKPTLLSGLVATASGRCAAPWNSAMAGSRVGRGRINWPRNCKIFSVSPSASAVTPKASSSHSYVLCRLSISKPTLIVRWLARRSRSPKTSAPTSASASVIWYLASVPVTWPKPSRPSSVLPLRFGR